VARAARPKYERCRDRQLVGDHLDGVARALFETDAAAGAQVEIDPVAAAKAEPGNRLLMTSGKAIVAFEAVAAGQATLCLATRRDLTEPGHDLFEAAHPFRQFERLLLSRIGLAEHRRAQHRERDKGRLRQFDIILATQPAVDVARGALAMPDRDRDGAFGWHHVAAREYPRMTRHQMFVDDYRAVPLELDAGHPSEEGAVGQLPERQHNGVGFEHLDLAGRVRPAVFVEMHALDGQRRTDDLLDAGQPLDLDAFLDRFVGLEGARRHVRPVAVIDDQRLVGAEPPGRARRIHRRVASAMDYDAAAEPGYLAGLGPAQKRQGVEHPCRIPRRDLDMPADMRADRDEDGIEATGVALGQDVVDFVVEDDLDAHFLDAADLALEVGARQPKGNASCRRVAVRLPGSRRHGRAEPDDRRPTVRWVRRR
jgi:hypothetical protein